MPKRTTGKMKNDLLKYKLRQIFYENSSLFQNSCITPSTKKKKNKNCIHNSYKKTHNVKTKLALY